MWNVYCNDILQLVLEAQAYADVYIFTFIRNRSDWQSTIDKIKLTLGTSLLRKTRAGYLGPGEDVGSPHLQETRTSRCAPPIMLDGKRFPFQDQEWNSTLGLDFTRHAKKVARDAILKMGCIRRGGDILDARVLTSLYKTHVCSAMKYSALKYSEEPGHLANRRTWSTWKGFRPERYGNRLKTKGTSRLQSLQHSRAPASVCGVCGVFS